MKLRNCPFCGSEPEVSMYGPLIEGEPRIVIWCVNSECPMDDVGGNNFDSEEAAIKAWNARTDARNRKCRICGNPVDPAGWQRFPEDLCIECA